MKTGKEPNWPVLTAHLFGYALALHRYIEEVELTSLEGASTAIDKDDVNTRRERLRQLVEGVLRNQD